MGEHYFDIQLPLLDELALIGVHSQRDNVGDCARKPRVVHSPHRNDTADDCFFVTFWNVCAAKNHFVHKEFRVRAEVSRVGELFL